jgi:hypothetical protein
MPGGGVQDGDSQSLALPKPDRDEPPELELAEAAIQPPTIELPPFLFQLMRANLYGHASDSASKSTHNARCSQSSETQTADTLHPSLRRSVGDPQVLFPLTPLRYWQ